MEYTERERKRERCPSRDNQGCLVTRPTDRPHANSRLQLPDSFAQLLQGHSMIWEGWCSVRNRLKQLPDEGVQQGDHFKSLGCDPGTASPGRPNVELVRRKERGGRGEPMLPWLYEYNLTLQDLSPVVLASKSDSMTLSVLSVRRDLL